MIKLKQEAMKYISISQLNIEAIAYQGKYNYLYVKFNNGAVYRYKPIDRLEYRKIKDNPAYFYKKIRHDDRRQVAKLGA